MTRRIPVSTIQNLWHDAQKVDLNDLNAEQNSNNQTSAAIVNNFFGSGVLVNSPSQPVLFDSSNLDVIAASLLSANKFDGSGINVDAQPSDNNLGNQIEIELTESDVFGRLSVKVLIIGVAFDGSLIYERFAFHRNEKQVSVKHYKQILTLMFNDFLGNGNCSLNNGGRIVIRESASFELSRDPIMVSQDVEPNLFFRDFKVSDGYQGLFNTIQNAIGSLYNADDLEINITGNTPESILPNDVTTQIGQKFLATTNNIQKITLLMGAVGDYTAPIANRFDWSGNLIVSIYPLQTTVSCPTDIIPELAIDFDPAITPLVEVSFSQAELLDQGFILTDVSQPVDFVFNSTKIAQSGGIIPGKYYAVTFRRSGSTTTGTIYCETGSDFTDNSRLTVFNGVWVDTNETDLWFKIYTDSAKISDGVGFDAGNGMQFDKTAIDEETGATIDNTQRFFSFANTGQATLNTGIIAAIEQDSVTIQDERTGNSTFSRKLFTPSFSFVDNAGLAQLQSISEPLIIGSVVDNNPKINPNITKTQTLPGLVKNDTFTIVNPDPDLLSLQLIGSKIIPNTNSSFNYRIFRTTFCVDGYGDVDGDGEITAADLTRATELLGESIHLASTQNKIVAGTINTLELLRCDVNGDGYITTADTNLIQNYLNKTINSFPVGSSFNHLVLQVEQSVGRNDGYYQCTPPYILIDGYKTLPSALDPQQLIYDGYYSPVMMNLDPAFSVVPFVSINFQIKFQPFWADYLLTLNSNSRILPTTFTNQTGVVINDCSNTSPFICSDRVGLLPTADSGRNDYFVPDNLIIGKGEVLRSDGSNYKVDFEVATIVLELPQSVISEKSINIFNVFVADANNNGLTAYGYQAQRYSDCSTVKPTDILENRIRFEVSIQSINSSLNVSGTTVANLIGVFCDQSTGLLTISSPYALWNGIFTDLRTRIHIVVYLKKGGFNNTAIIVPNNETAGLFS
jgi:hypothetical protein